MVINRIVRVCMYIHYKDSLFRVAGSTISNRRSWSTQPHILSFISGLQRRFNVLDVMSVWLPARFNRRDWTQWGGCWKGEKTVKRGLAGSPFKTPGFGSSTHMGMAQFYHRRYAKFTLQVVWGEFLLWLVVAELSKSTCAQKCSTLSVYVTSLPHLTKHRLNVFC